MKEKNKGRKIYKTKEKNIYQKSAGAKFFSVGLTVLFLGGIAFLGYSVAEPIMNFTKKKGDTDASVITTEAATSESGILGDIDVDIINNPAVSAAEIHGAMLNVADLGSLTSLEAAVNRVTVDSEAEYVFVPLKSTGGSINFTTVNNKAILAGASTGRLSLSDICSTIRTAGYKPVAYVSLLSDNIYPQTYPESCYKTVDDGSRWIDNSAENNGKYWLSPFTEEGKEYVNSLVNEIVSADFDHIVCADLIFPNFRASDLELLDDEVNDPERYLVLTSMMNTIYSSSLTANCSAILEVSAADVAQDRAEVLQPMVLQISTLCVNVNMDELANGIDVNGMPYDFNGSIEENLEKILGLIKDKVSDFNVIIRISGKGSENADYNAVKEIVNKYGFKSYEIG